MIVDVHYVQYFSALDVILDTINFSIVWFSNGFTIISSSMTSICDLNLHVEHSY